MMHLTHIPHADQVTKSYHRAVIAGDFVFPCGQIPTDPEGNTPDSMRDQTLVALNNLEKELLSFGSSLKSIVQVTVYLCSQDDFLDYDNAWREKFTGKPLPPRTTVFVSGFRGNKRIEITAIAAKEEESRR
jgi:2-iminobutanoate/2-iminopropanoate deaminase